MKKISALILAAAMLSSMALTGCACKHKEWEPATCSEPEKCKECGDTRGEPLGHDWTEANCTSPKTCSRCGETDGEPLGHDWTEADCDTPRTCKLCGATEGEPLGHNWQPADCSRPETCSRCGETKGEKTTDHKWTEATCSRPKTCTVCGKTEGSALPHTWKDADCTSPKKCSVCGKTDGSALGHDYHSGICSRCGGREPGYVFPSDIHTLKELEDHLNKNYSVIHTPAGDITGVKYEIRENSLASAHEYFPYDFSIISSPSMFIPKATIDTGNGTSSLVLPTDLDNIHIPIEIRTGVANAIREHWRSVADFSMAAFPGQKILGGNYYYVSTGVHEIGGEYKWLDGGSLQYFTWCNYTSSGFSARCGQYSSFYAGAFQWATDRDGK